MKERVAEKLNELGLHLSRGLDEAIESVMEGNCVAIYGLSDDLMEFRGAIRDELGAWSGTTAYLNSDGLVINKCDDDYCPYHKKETESAKMVRACWAEEDGYSWTFETDIPHATFEITEDGEPFCRGIVIDLDEI